MRKAFKPAQTDGELKEQQVDSRNCLMKHTSHKEEKVVLKRTMVLTGGAAAFFGSLGLIAWITGENTLSSFSSDFIPMAPDTAVLFLLLGSMLIVQAFTPWRKRGKAIDTVVIALAAVYGLLKFVEYFIGLDLTFESNLFPVTEHLGSFPLKRMSPVTGLSFFVSGVALLHVFLSDAHRTLQNVAASLGGLALIVGFVATTGYLFGTPFLYGGNMIPLAPTTALGFVFLGAGLMVAAGQENIFIRQFTGPSVSARLMRVFLPLAAAGIFLSTWLHEALDKMADLPWAAMVAASLSLSFMGILSVVVFFVSRVISRAIDTADEQRRKAEQLQAESETKYQSIFSESRDGIVLIDYNTGRIVDCNPEFERQTGQTRAQLLQMMTWDIRPPGQAEVVRQRFQELKEEREAIWSDLGYLRPDGVYVPIESFITTVNIGGRQYFQGVTRNITERKRAEEQVQKSRDDLEERVRERTAALLEANNALQTMAHRLHESLGQFRTLVDTMPDGLSVYNSQRHITMVNQRMADMLGYTLEDMIGKDVLSLAPASQRRGVDDQLARRLLGETGTYECDLLAKNGELIPVLISGAPKLSAEGNITGGVAVIADLREIKRLQNEKARAEKMAALGQLTAIVAHELRNPLATISNMIYYLKMRAGNDEKIEWHLAAGSRAVASGARVMEDLLDYTRPKQAVLQPMPLNSVVEDALARASVDENITIQRKFTQDMSPLYGDAEMLRRTFLNIIINAIQAMPRGGTLTIGTHCENGWQEVAIADTGQGIDAETQRKLFQPLFSTKAKGVGLGLYISEQTVGQHGGTISLTSEPGKGTTVTIRLPVERRL